MCECYSRLTRCWCCWRAGCCSGWWCSSCRTSSTPPSGTVLYCIVLYCTVLTYPTPSTGDQAAPLPTVSVSPPGDAVPVQGGDQDSVQFVQVRPEGHSIEFFKGDLYSRHFAHFIFAYLQDILQYLISSGDSLRQDVLSLWRDKLTHYAKIHSQEVTSLP